MNVPSPRQVARRASSPLRGFFNRHFEMVKAEVRATDARGQIESLQAVVADLESDLVEQSVHHARVLSRVRSDLEQVDARIAELERLVGRLADVVAAATLHGVETSGTD